MDRGRRAPKLEWIGLPRDDLRPRSLGLGPTFRLAGGTLAAGVAVREARDLDLGRDIYDDEIGATVDAEIWDPAYARG